MTVTYDEYITIYQGKATEEEFNKLLPRVELLIDDQTNGRYKKLPTESEYRTRAIMCVGESLDFYIAYATDISPVAGVKQSESVGPWSVTYAEGSVPQSVAQGLARIVMTWFGSTYLCSNWV